jgi:hypothetical protein
MKILRRCLTFGLMFGLAVALLCGVWFSVEHGEGREAAFLVAAVLSLPLSQAVAIHWPVSGTAPYDLWFVAVVPVVNGLFLGTTIGAILGLARWWHVERRPPAV